MPDQYSLSAEALDPVLPEETSASEIYRPLKDPVYIAGLVLLAISAGVFLHTGSGRGGALASGAFFLNYFLVWTYMAVLWGNKRLRWWIFGSNESEYPTTLLMLLLWMVSCFSLNTELNVFPPPTSWFSWQLGVSGLACIAYAWKGQMPSWGRNILYFILGITFVWFGYYMLAIAPLAIVGQLAIWFFGLSLHALIPLVFTIYIGIILFKDANREFALRVSAISGMALPLAAAIVFATTWYGLSSGVQLSMKAWEKQGDHQLPRWVEVSRNLKPNFLNGYLFKSVATGTFPSRPFLGMDWFNLGNAPFTDPVMQVASAVSPQTELTAAECKKIYNALFDGRHEMETRYWSDNDLETRSVDTRVMLDPAHRISYTDKKIVVGYENAGSRQGGRQQEALYTFYLPEGGVVSSLSLWVNGVESPAVLTTKSKAHEAYQGIVQVERRDPAVVFWQEGNRALVRVFPVQPEMPRTFRIGVSAPMRLEEKRLVYEPVTFDGPSAFFASATDSLYFHSTGRFEEVPNFFDETDASNPVFYKGKYRVGWKVECEAPAPAVSSFTFDGKQYETHPLTQETEVFEAEKVYADLNASWTADEWRDLTAACGEKSLWVWHNGQMREVTPDNASVIFREAREKQYDLFPFYLINRPERVLVVSKGFMPTPVPTDLQESEFGNALRDYKPDTPIRLFHLSAESTPYLRALQESRTIFRISGTKEQLTQYLAQNTFVKNPENDKTVPLPSAQICIRETEGAPTGLKAPDHLFRLFAYNKIMQSLGNKSEEDPALVRLAEQAYVVTPVSSLITLESDADYKRFDIKKTDGLNSLGNAGSVPEPREWALIGLLLLSLWYIRRFSIV